MLIGNKLGTFLKQEKAKCLKINYLAFYLVPRAGVEPARITPLVFETSASTDSAIWACAKWITTILFAQIANAKVDNFRDTDKLLVYFFTSRPIVS